MKRGRRKPPCEWQFCDAQSVGWRRHWQYGHQMFAWLCRPHQRRYDKGVRHSPRQPREEFYE